MEATGLDRENATIVLADLARIFRSIVEIYRTLMEHEQGLHSSLRAPWQEHAMLIRRTEFPARLLIQRFDTTSDFYKSNAEALYTIDQLVHQLLLKKKNEPDFQNSILLLDRILSFASKWQRRLSSEHEPSHLAAQPYLQSSALENWPQEMEHEFEAKLRSLDTLFETPQKSRFQDLIGASTLAVLSDHVARAISTKDDPSDLTLRSLYWNATILGLNPPMPIKKVAIARLKLLQYSIRSNPGTALGGRIFGTSTLAVAN